MPVWRSGICDVRFAKNAIKKRLRYREWGELVR